MAAPLSLEPGRWICNPLQWHATGGGLRASGGRTDGAVCQRAPIARRVVVEADIQVRRAVGESWKVAGVGIHRDPRNFWHFAVVEEPDSTDRRHFCELCEMRDGEWLSQRNLKTVVDEGGDEAWQTGKTYRLRIAIDPTGVEGSLAALDGRVIQRRRYAFVAEAVTVGRPMLRCGGFEADFTKVRAEYSEPVPAPKPTFAPYRSESHVPDVKGKATGFFQVERRGAKWWAIDPLGRGFIPLGVDHVRYTGHWCEKLGYAPHGRKNDEKYASREEWAKETLDRLLSWRFNLLTASASPQLFRRGLAHTRFVAIGSIMADLGDEYDITPHEGRPCSAFPNVFHPDFERYCAHRAQQVCSPFVGDPWMFGYFLDNELAWWGRGSVETGLFDATLKKASTHRAKLALRDFLAERYNRDVKQLNAAWGTELKAFDDVLSLTALTGPNRDTVTADKKAFLALIAERYFGIITRAIRAVDPDHLILGCRFAGGHAADVVWAAAGRHCEVLTFNYYGNVDLDNEIARDHKDARVGRPLAEAFAEFHRLGGRPMMITEWSFPALDSGLPCSEGAGQRFRTQAERARATEIYARTILRMPFMVGFDYFMWVDEPALGISSTFPENTNYGLVNEEGKPYDRLVSALSGVNRIAGQLRHEGLAKLHTKPAQATGAPQGPPDTQLVLWNRTDEALRAALVWLPTVAQRGGTFEVFEGKGWRSVPAQIMPRPAGFCSAAVRIDGVKPRQALFLRGRESSVDPVPHSSLRFERNGEQYLVATDRFELRGRLGGPRFFEEVSHRGTALGGYNAMLHQCNTRNQWVDINRVADIQATIGPVCMTLDLVGHLDTESPEGDPRPFEMAHRLTFFPGADWFVAELLWCRNTGTRPIGMRGFFFRFYGAIGGDAKGDDSVRGQVPRLWGAAPGDAWFDEEVGAFWGCVAPALQKLQIRFWLNEGGGQHPDARLALTQTLTPGATYRPPRPVYVFGVAGQGGRARWQAQALEVSRTASLVSPPRASE